MENYLVVVCRELNDQYECDADRIPYCITGDWMSNHPKDEFYEVYQVLGDGKIGNLVKAYNEPIEEGMAFGFYEEDSDDFHLLQKFEKRTRLAKIPPNVEKKMKAMNDYRNRLNSCGYVIAEDHNFRVFIYGEYHDNFMPTFW